MSEAPKKKNNTLKRKGADKFKGAFNLDLDDILTKDEEVIMTGNVHWGIYWKPCVVLVFAILVAVFVFIELGIILGLAGVFMLSHAVIKSHMLLLILTNKRILARYGILQVDVVDIRFKNIESVELERMLPAFLMGYSSVIVMGTGNRYIYIPYIGNGIAFRRAFNELVLDEDEVAEDAKSRARQAADYVGDDAGSADKKKSI